VATGKKVMAAAAKNLTPVVLELGGKDAASSAATPTSTARPRASSGARS
jgi:acyl-CoA reductase-like NAD-dependent aldehyde dehydrogenase